MDERESGRKLFAGGGRESATSSAGVAQREIVEDRAIRPVVAVTSMDKVAQGLGHRLHIGDTRVEVADMRFRDPFDLPARSRPIAPEREQSADFRDRKPSRRARRMNLSSWMSRSP
jgi:hypothetical protein